MLSLTLRKYGYRFKPKWNLSTLSANCFSTGHDRVHTLEDKKSHIKFEFEHKLHKEMQKDEKGFHDYCKSIGIPSKDSSSLALFLHRTYNSLPEGNLTSDQIKLYILNSLNSFKSLPDNRWNTFRVSELKSILVDREKELANLHVTKQKLDKRALRIANSALYLGGSVLVGQFCFIVGGTYIFFCWDVMEPMAYLMLTSNLTIAFFYYWMRELDLGFESLQGRFKNAFVSRIYKRNKFDFAKFQQLEQDVMDLRELINKSV